MAERKFYYYVCTNPDGSVSKWAAAVPPWYGHPQAKAAMGNFHPFADAWDDDTGFDIQEIDCDADEEVVAVLRAICDSGSEDILDVLENYFEIEDHPTNLTRKKLSKTGAVPADRSWGTVLVKLKKKAAAVLPD